MITYNHETYISDAIEGVLMQKTTFPFELIIGEDCSTDNTRDICIEYQNKYPNIIKLNFPEKNMGVLHNFTNTLKSGNGKYIAFCEGDDYWIDSSKLQEQVNFLESHSDYGLVFTDVNWYYQEKNKLIKSVFKNGIIKHKIDFNWHLINSGYFAPCTWLCRKEYLPSIESKTYVDSTFPWLLDIMAVSKVYFLSKTTTNYRVLPESASHSKNVNNTFQYMNDIYQIKLDYVKKYNVNNSILWVIKQKHYDHILIMSIMSDNNESIKECLDFFSTNKPLRNQTKLVIALCQKKYGRAFIKSLYAIMHR